MKRSNPDEDREEAKESSVVMLPIKVGDEANARGWAMSSWLTIKDADPPGTGLKHWRAPYILLARRMSAGGGAVIGRRRTE